MKTIALSPSSVGNDYETAAVTIQTNYAAPETDYDFKPNTSQAKDYAAKRVYSKPPPPQKKASRRIQSLTFTPKQAL